MADDEDPLHHGNTITILSSKYGLVTGRIIYRDLNMIRLMSNDASDRALEFPMTADGSSFAPELGVTDIYVDSIQPSDYYVDTLGAQEGEFLEFFTADGTEAAAPGVVAAIIKTPTEDALRLVDGRILSFNGNGPELPIVVIRVTTKKGEAEKAPETQEQPKAVQFDILSLLRGVLPAATVEVIPSAERTFPDSIQREEMLQDLLADIPEKQRTNPRRIRLVEREVDLALALKNRTTLRDADGKSLGPNTNSIVTFKDAVQETVMAAAIPIVKAAKILNIDSLPANAQYKPTDVAPRSLAQNESDSEMLAHIYLNGAAPEFTGGLVEKAKGLGFFSYMYDLFERDAHTLVGAEGAGWAEDQDVIRTAGINVPVQGLSKDLTERANITPAFLLSDVTDRSMRVLTSDVSVHLKSGVRSLVAPSDPSTIEGYVILPIKAALSLRPPKNPGDLPTALLYSAYLTADNLPTIAQTIRDLNSQDADPLHAWTVTDKEVQLADWLIKVLPYAIHPSEAMGPRTPQLLSILDALGVGNRDLSPPVHDVVMDWVAKSQRIWRTLLKEKRTAVQAILDAEGELAFDALNQESLLFVPASEKRAVALQGLIDEFGKRNPSIKGSWSMITASLLTEAQGDGLPLLYSYIQKTDGLLETVDEVSATSALKASQAFTVKRKALQGLDLRSLKAAPEVSKCPHVPRLEKIRNIMDVLKRGRLLRDFIEKYQGPRVGSWMTCALCTGGCVCYHEIMELEALAQPSRMESIQKQIMVLFGGERYEGKIVCKNCGQALQDIDYDQHVEFDDDGKAILGRSVLTEEQLADVTEGIKLDAPAALTFVSKPQQEIAEALQVIVDRAGIRMSEAVIRRIVRYVDVYVGARAPPPAAYETQRAKALASAATKIKAATGSEIGAVDVPTYAAVLDQLRVTALAGLVALALQTADPPLEITTPFALCEFSRGGWPLEPEAPKDGKGAVLYISCVVASIQRDHPPWRSVAWSGLSKLETRRAAVLKAVIAGLSVIVVGDPKTGPLTFTPEIRTDLVRAQTDVDRQARQAMVTLQDSLTHGFRPEVNPPSVQRPALEKNPLSMVETALKAGGPTAELKQQLRGAMQQLALSNISSLHSAAAAGLPGIKFSTTDAVCCPTPLQDVKLAGQTSIGLAYSLLDQKGTRLWQKYSEEEKTEVEQSVDESIYFKLFLRFCYSGPFPGKPHEFSVGNVCRQCGLDLKESPDTINVDKDGAGILARQEGPLKIEITAATFETLSTLVRRNKKIEYRSGTVADQSWKVGLEKIVALSTKEFTEFAEALRKVLEDPLPPHNSEKDEDIQVRAIAWGPVAVLHDELKAQIVDRVGPLVPRQSGKIAEARANEAVTAFETFDKILEDPFVEGPRTLLEYWCTKVSAAGRGFGVTTVAGAKWFKISQKHNEHLNALLLENSSWYAGDIPDAMRPVLVKMSERLAPFIRAWISSIRPGAWTIEEARLVLRCLVFHVWRDSVSTTSWLYEDIGVAAERETVASAMSNWTRALLIHMKRQVFKYDKETIRRILQERAELERTSVVKEFEDIKDDDQRAAELMKKGFRIGRWGVGKNLQKYDSDLFEFESEQRLRMGIADAPVDPLLLEGAQPQVENFGLAALGGAEEGYDVVQDTSED